MGGMIRLAFVCLSFFTCVTRQVRASEGDQAQGYRGCVQRCTAVGRAWWPGLIDGIAPSMCERADVIPGLDWDPFFLRLSGWNCEDDCKYHCMHLQEQHRDLQGLPVAKYHGKWPFVRVLGYQEFCSSMFSLLNLVAHVVGYRRLNNVCQQLNEISKEHAYPYLYLIAVSALFNINTWFWSWMFHMRDTPFTEAMDYLSASSNLFMGCFLCIVRVGGLRRSSDVSAVGVPVALVALAHMFYMLLVKFDYGWNMTVCLTCGIGQACVWMVWVIYVTHPIRWHFIFFFVGMHGIMLLEVLDFPPIMWGLVDTHSLWHLLTPPFVLLWYSFFEHDARHNAERHLCVVLSPDHLGRNKGDNKDD